MEYLIDENLPDGLQIWASKDFLHVTKIARSISDKNIWNYAVKNNLIILTKDSDFHERILYKEPPPKVVLFRLGNTSIAYLENFLETNWTKILEQINFAKLVIFFRYKIEGIK
jgi:predicted nuclease of predicted toxin-antitoxin system